MLYLNVSVSQMHYNLVYITIPMVMNLITALLSLDQLHHPTGDSKGKFGSTRSLFIQYFFSGLRVWLWCMYVTATIVETIILAN